MLISVTRLELRSFWKIFSFIALSGKAQRQAKKAEGNRSMAVSNRGFRYFYSLTSWDSKERMLDFMNSGAHEIAMKRSRELAKSVKSIHFESDTVPTWKDAIARLENSIRDQ